MEIQSNAISPSGAISEGWELIKDDYGMFFAMSLVFIIIIFAISFAIGMVNNGITMAIAAILGIAKPEGNTAATIAAIMPQIIGATIGIFTEIIVTTLSGVLLCGMYKAFARKLQSGVVEFGDLFSGFDKWKPCLIFSIILSLVKYVIAIGTLIVGVIFGVSLNANALLKDGKFDPKMFSGLIGIIIVFVLIALLLQLAVAIATIFVLPLIAEQNLSGIEAMSNSFRGALKNIFPLIGLVILQGLMAIGGILLCLVGVLFVLPILQASMFTAYRSVFGGPTNNYMNQQPPPPPIFYNQPGY
jgi:hypothetical protein